MEGDAYVRAQTHKYWDRARQSAIIEELLTAIRGRSADLLSFDEVKSRLHLTQSNYRGIHEVPLDQIRGSVGRYRDFTRTFLPRSADMRARWERVSRVAYSQGMDPIEVYKVGDAYFVLDGNHRVSIARQFGASTIEAHVWEYDTPLGLSGQADLDEVLIKEEYRHFLERTGLGAAHPDLDIAFTVPGRYRELEYQIELFQRTLEQIDGEPVTFQQAAAAWYDLIYTPAIQIIRQRGVMERFPDRTEADLFVWVWRHHRALQEQEGEGSLARAAEEVRDRAGSRSRRLWRAVRRFLRAQTDDEP